MQPELCLENHTPQSSPVSEAKPEALPAPPLPVATADLEEGRRKRRRDHQLHRTWANMIQRCTNPNNTHFSEYGGRGITVCERWRSFPNFLEDVGPKPSNLHTLERKDNDGNYCPENIRWATRLEQGQNRRDNHILEHNGLRLTVSEWSRRLGVSYVCILNRIQRGWSVSDAVTLPPKQ